MRCLNDTQLKSFDELRNQLMHTEEVELTENDAMAYIMVALNLVNQIKEHWSALVILCTYIGEFSILQVIYSLLN